MKEAIWKKTAWAGVLGFFLCALGFPLSALALSSKVLPLFEGEEVLEITLSGPLDDLIDAANSGKDAFPAELVLKHPGPERTFEIQLSPRGESRRTLGICRFPPLKVDLKKDRLDGTLFEGQNKIKLVTHCQKSDRYQQFALKEYAIYRAYNVLTSLSFRVRMARITYIDTNGKRDPLTRYGFFIEDIDDLAARHGMEEIEPEKINVSDLEPRQATVFALFQYLIANLDWSNIRGPRGEECCHNAKLISSGGRIEAGSVIPVPYDFDFSGLVDTPYAVPPENVSVRSVRQRLYRGFCRHNGYLDEVKALFLEKQAEIKAVFENESLLSERERRKTSKFIEDFFETLKDDKKARRAFEGRCIR